jgi:N-acetylglucosamine transport system permease protein
MSATVSSSDASVSEGTGSSALAPRNRHKTTRGDRAFNVVAHIVLIIWAVVVVLPLLWTFMSSFKDSLSILADPFALPETLHWENFSRAWTTAGIGTYFFNTVLVVGFALVLVMLLGAMCAHALARFQFPGRMVIYFSLIAGLTFPPFLAIVPLFFVLQNMGLLGTYPGLILVYVAFALPFTVFFLYAFYRQLPEEISEAAAIDGAGDFRTFFQLMLPMAKPGMVSVAIFNFLGLWNQYLIPVVLNTDKNKYVLAQGLANMQAQQGYQTDWSGMFASVTITILPVLIVYVIFQRQLQGGVGPSTDK